MDIFASMSNLVADAEDLLGALARSDNPEIQALSAQVESSIDDMKVILRRRLKARIGAIDDAPVRYRDFLADNRWALAVGAAFATALLIGVNRYSVRRR
jgi:ElaB/YqjD/DUF883 family membrane-anchored ribosome-binding protein